MLTHVDANSVADYLLWLWAQEREDERDFITPMKLQKLLYFVQGWSWATRNEPAFGEAIEGWRDGPVVRRIWERYKALGGDPIREVPEAAPVLPESVQHTVRDVWEAYRRYSAWELSRRTHDEQPWREAREGLEPDVQGNRALRPETMRREFRSQIEASRQRLRSRRDAVLARARTNTTRATGRPAL